MDNEPLLNTQELDPIEFAKGQDANLGRLGGRIERQYAKDGKCLSTIP